MFDPEDIEGETRDLKKYNPWERGPIHVCYSYARMEYYSIEVTPIGDRYRANSVVFEWVHCSWLWRIDAEDLDGECSIWTFEAFYQLVEGMFVVESSDCSSWRKITFKRLVIVLIWFQLLHGMEKASEQESLAPSYWLVMMWKQRNTNLSVRYEMLWEEEELVGNGFLWRELERVHRVL